MLFLFSATIRRLADEVSLRNSNIRHFIQAKQFFSLSGEIHIPAFAWFWIGYYSENPRRDNYTHLAPFPEPHPFPPTVISTVLWTIVSFPVRILRYIPHQVDVSSMRQTIQVMQLRHYMSNYFSRFLSSHCVTASSELFKELSIQVFTFPLTDLIKAIHVSTWILLWPTKSGLAMYVIGRRRIVPYKSIAVSDANGSQKRDSFLMYPVARLLSPNKFNKQQDRIVVIAVFVVLLLWNRQFVFFWGEWESHQRLCRTMSASGIIIQATGRGRCYNCEPHC